MTILKEMLELKNTPARDSAEVLAEALAERGGIDYLLPPLTTGARAYLARFDGDRPCLILAAWGVAAEYGSLKTHRIHAVKAAQRLGLYGRNEDEI